MHFLKRWRLRRIVKQAAELERQNEIIRRRIDTLYYNYNNNLTGNPVGDLEKIRLYSEILEENKDEMTELKDQL